jgi:cell division protein FtsI/penicillin-binding protein 2
MGAAPATNPQIATLVMIRRPDPNVGYYGGTIAAEPAGEILAKTLAYLGVPPDDLAPEP